jgi:hypothetical protein
MGCGKVNLTDTPLTGRFDGFHVRIRVPYPGEKHLDKARPLYIPGRHSFTQNASAIAFVTLSDLALACADQPNRG